MDVHRLPVNQGTIALLQSYRYLCYSLYSKRNVSHIEPVPDFKLLVECVKRKVSYFNLAEFFESRIRSRNCINNY